MRTRQALVALWLGVMLIAAGGGCAHGIKYQVAHCYDIDSPQFTATMGNLLGPGIVAGNKVVTLKNGDRIFPEMLAAIRSARNSVNFETFVYWKGEVGQAFADALSERAKAGVKVHVIIDWLGGDKIDDDYLKEMRDAGIEVVRYHQVHWYNVPTALSVDHRTHRKLLVIDGRVGFIGGVGIADEWKGDARDEHEWRDNHYRVEGPVVGQLQAAFLDNWMKTTGEVLHGEAYFPVLSPVKDDGHDDGVMAGQVFKSSRQGGSESMRLLYLLSVAAARDHIRLATAYFVPDELTTKALIDARKRGVRVEVLIPGKHIDIESVRSASRSKWGPLLKAGIEVYEYRPTMFHTKLAIFDDRWVSIGSSNLDPRSFELNDEANLNVLDEQFAAEQIRIFEEDKSKATRITYEMWDHRGFWTKVGEVLPSVFSHEL